MASLGNERSADPPRERFPVRMKSRRTSQRRHDANQDASASTRGRMSDDVDLGPITLLRLFYRPGDWPAESRRW